MNPYLFQALLATYLFVLVGLAILGAEMHWPQLESCAVLTLLVTGLAILFTFLVITWVKVISG